MTNKLEIPLRTPPSSSLPSPRSRSDALLDALLSIKPDAKHERILRAYKNGSTVEAAEREFSNIIQEIIDEA